MVIDFYHFAGISFRAERHDHTFMITHRSLCTNRNHGPLNLRVRLLNALREFCGDEQGQDLIEYTLLLAFVALASAALFIGAGQSVMGIWTTTNNQLSAANSAAS